MKDKKQKDKKQIQQDRHLQTPGEANRDKHIILLQKREVNKTLLMKEE
jgi:hypothetical protein